MSHTKKEEQPASRVTLLSLESFQPAFSRTSILGAVMGGAVAIAPLAHGQNADGDETVTLDTVKVTDEAINTYQTPTSSGNARFTASLVDTPKTVTVIPQALMRDRGATSLQDVLRTTPGVTLGSGEGGTPSGDRPMIRGYEASTDLFVDGIRDYSRGSHETFNLEAIEVIKGPSSAYTGRGGTGGSINMQTKQARLENFVAASAGYGNGDQYRVTADGNIKLGESTAFRLNAMNMGGDVPGRDVIEYDRSGLSASLGFGLETDTRVVLGYSHIVNEDTPDWGIPFNNAATDRAKPLKPSRDNFYGRAGIDYRKNEFDTYTVDAEHDLTERLTVRNVTRLSKSMQEYLYTRPSFDNCSAGAEGPCATEGPELQFRRADRARWRSAESLVNQTELRGSFDTGSLKHHFFAGAEFSKEDIYSRNTVSGMGGPGGSDDSFWNPNPKGDFGDRNLAFGSKFQNGSIKTKSVYFFDTVEIDPQWMVNLGVRVDDFRVQNTQNDQRRDDTMWNYQAGAVYKPATNGSVYLSYGTSSNPAGENFGQAGGADGPAGGAALHDLKPEKSRSWELGTKWDLLDARLTLTAAAFETEKTDARSTDPVTGDVSLSGNNRVRGIELSAAGAITSKWDIWAGYSYLDPEIKKYRSGNNVFDGNQIKFIAKNSATLWTTYKPLPEWTVGGGVSYVGKRFVDDNNSLYMPSHTVYDAMVRYDVNEQLSLQLNANNLTDTEVYDASHVGIFANVGPGRSYMLTANYRFDF